MLDARLPAFRLYHSQMIHEKKKDSFMTGRDDNDGEEGEEHLMPLCVPRFQLQIRGPQRNESRDSQEINPEMSLRATRVRRRKKK
jgi:hypothetical protein